MDYISDKIKIFILYCSPKSLLLILCEWSGVSRPWKEKPRRTRVFVA